VIGAGALIMTLLLFVFFNRETKKSAPVSPAISSEKLVATQSEEQPVTEKAVAAKKELPGQPVLSAVVTVPDTLSASPKIRVVAESVPVAPKPAVPPSVQSGSAAPVKTEAKAVVPASVAGPVAESVVKAITVETTPFVKKKSTEIPMLGAEKLPKKNTIIPSINPEPVVKNKKLLLSTQEQKAKAPQQLPRKSAAVGESWLAGEKNEHYTLQLMVLADGQAEDKLKEILHNEETRQMSDNFIVLSKSTSPSTLILFYGEYPTLAEAREARNNLPPSLQQYGPYPVSVKQAVQKSNE
jgi:septal ring-binding cell division protein DamX